MTPIQKISVLIDQKGTDAGTGEIIVKVIIQDITVTEITITAIIILERIRIIIHNPKIRINLRQIKVSILLVSYRVVKGEIITRLQQNNPNNSLNFQPSTSNNINCQEPVKRQRESQSGQSRMDVNFHQTATCLKRHIRTYQSPCEKKLS